MKNEEKCRYEGSSSNCARTLSQFDRSGKAGVCAATWASNDVGAAATARAAGLAASSWRRVKAMVKLLLAPTGADTGANAELPQ
ncbi:hypothetical protein GCM10007235_01690 [Pseudoxanthomonas indica]|nr:hypothetical protein GCM10007235_01690 [Pseudoxanthomonas indica]